MTQVERQKLIELGVLTPDCGPSIAYPKLSPETRRQPTDEEEGANDWWTSSDQDLGAPKNSALNRQDLSIEKGRNKMTQRHREQSMGLEILRPDDTTLWKRALKSKPGRTANERKLIFSRQPRPGILSMIFERLKRPR
jgi:hypothetical protein